MKKRSHSQSLRNRRELLWREDPRCHWCGRETILMAGTGKDKGYVALMATIDHLYDKLHPNYRELVNAGAQRTFLACRECNERRTTQLQAETPEARRLLDMTQRAAKLKKNPNSSWPSSYGPRPAHENLDN